MSILSVRGVRARYADGTLVALPDLEVAAGERVAVVGVNGCGKSTLLRVLAGVLDAEGAVVRPARSGWVAQRPYLFTRTAIENVAISATGATRGARTEAARAALASVGGADLADRPARALSEGQTMRVALARALVAAPVLLLDEPLAPLDAEGVRLAAAAVLAVPGVTVVAAAPGESSLAALRPTRVVRFGG